MTAPTVEVEVGEGRAGGHQVRLAGQVVIAGLGALERALAEVRGPGPIRVDLGAVEALDTAGAWALVNLERRLQAEGADVEFTGAGPDRQALIDAVARNLVEKPETGEPPHGLTVWLANVGARTIAGFDTGRAILSFLGIVMVRLLQTVVRPWRLRATSLFFHMQAVGLNAVPIVALMAFLIGIVLAFQGATQLRQFGAEVFVVDLIAISILRELGILLTAIIVAGRSGSAFTAAIGSMKIREEIDAMRTLGLDPAEVLVLPRVIALMIMLPVLGFIANIVGLFGGAMMSWIELGVSPGMFLTRLREGTDLWHFGVGMIKAPFFAIIIGVVGCFQGFQVAGSADSVGQRTTASVVLSIFLVLVTDAIFSIFFAEIGV
ncbi:MAG: MlaE family lipid ABC transporter permease subunit [Pseudomonadota bacterium]